MQNYDTIWAAVQGELRRKHYTGRVFGMEKLGEYPQNEEELRRRLGRRWRKQVANLTGLCWAVHHLTSPLTELCEFPISCKSNGMLARFGSWQNVSKVLKQAREVGLVVCTDEYFSSGAGVAKCYIFNKNVEKLLMDVSKEEKIKPKMPMNFNAKKMKNVPSCSSCSSPSSLSSLTEPSPNGATIQVADEQNKPTTSCSSSYSLSLPSPNDATIQNRVHIGRMMLRGATREEVEDALMVRYPQLGYLQRLADDLNREYHHNKPAEQILFRPNINITRRGICTNASIRATSTACGLPSREKAYSEERVNDADVKLWREDYLTELFRLPYELLAHYDVKSSIYRTTYFMNTGVWVAHEVDFYPLMYAGLRPDDPDGYEFETTEQRADFKQGCMRLYFSPSAADQLNRMKRAGLLSPYYTKEEHLAAIEEARRRMRLAVGGRTYGSEVFLHESAILMLLRRELYCQGVRTSQCYDGFWSDNPRLGELCEELLPKVAQEYRQKWC